MKLVLNFILFDDDEYFVGTKNGTSFIPLDISGK